MRGYIGKTPSPMVDFKSAGSFTPATATRKIIPRLAIAILLAFGSIAAFASNTPPSETMAERRVRQLVNEERRMLAGLQRSDGSFDEELLERRYQDLVQQYEALIGENPDFAPAFVAFAVMLERIGQNETARAMFMRANQIDPNIPLVKNQLGNFLAEDGEFYKALSYFLAAVELDPNEPIYHFQIGNLLHEFRGGFMERGLFTRDVLDRQMLAAFREATRLAPENIMFAYRHAEAFYDLAEPSWEEASEHWRRLELRVQPGIERQAVQLHIANTALKQGDPARARELTAAVDAPMLQRQKLNLLRDIRAAETGIKNEAESGDERHTEKPSAKPGEK